MRETGGAVAIGARDRLSMIYFGQSRNGLTLGVQLDVGSRIPIATTAMGRAYLWALAPDERAALLRELREHYGSRWPKMRDGIERSGETVARYGFAISAGEWQDDVHAVGVALKLNDGTGTYAFNCGAPAFRFTEDRLMNDIGPRMVAMVRNIEAALGGSRAASQKRRKQEGKGGKCACGRGDQVAVVRRPADQFAWSHQPVSWRAQRNDAGTARAGQCSPARGSRRQRRVRRHHRAERRDLRHAQGPDPRTDRAERRRQDHAVQLPVAGCTSRLPATS